MSRASSPRRSPAACSQRCRISVRYLHALFAGEASFSARLLEHRLEVCRSELSSPNARERARSIGEIAFGAGFNNLTHFCRTFKARFGLTPSEVRGRCTAPHPPTAPSAHSECTLGAARCARPL